MFAIFTENKGKKTSKVSEQLEAQKQQRTIWTESPTTPGESQAQERRQNLWLGLTALVSGALFR
jgi:hypothetical protein